MQELVSTRNSLDDQAKKSKQQSYQLSDLKNQILHWEEKELSLEKDKRDLRNENDQYSYRIKELVQRV